MSDQPEGLARASAVLLALLPGGLWCVWWLCAVNWKKMAPVLREGAWAPVVLLILVAAAVWSRLAPAEADLGGVPLPNFWWQLACVVTLAAVALFCGWLQNYYGWTPREVSVEPPAHADHDHGHDHIHTALPDPVPGGQGHH